MQNNDFVYLYNGKYWILLNKEMLHKFLGEAAEKWVLTGFQQSISGLESNC